ncbi:MAG: outer membrane beta-barrel protein [Pseudomonadota bacterium]
MKIVKPLLIAAALSALPLSAFSQTLSYNYLEGGYLKATQEDGNADDYDFDGFTVGASGKVAEQLFLFGDYRAYESDTVNGTRINIDTARVGLGFIIPVNANFDINLGGGAAFSKFDFEGSGAGLTPEDNDDTGYFLQTIARAKVLPALEINGGYRYEKVFDESESTGLVGAVFNFTPAFAAVGNYEFGDDYNRYTLGGRFSFGL